MPGISTTLRTRGFGYVVGVAGFLVLLWFVPLFHVVPLEATRQQEATTVFNAADYIDEFWQGPLSEAASGAIDATELLAAFDQDYDAAAERYGHRLGMSGTSYYLVSGQGQISAVESMAVRIELNTDNQAEVVIGTGPIFGNSIRDGSGLFNVSDFANIQDFNAISAEINRRVEEQVLPLLRENGAVGAEVYFAGGVEVADAGGAPSSLNLVPVVIEIP